MTTQRKKAAQIRKLLHLSNAEIAESTGHPEAYIRTVRQRTDSNGRPVMAPGEAAWLAANRDYMLQRKREHSAKRYADPVIRESQKAAQKRRYASDPEYRKRRAEAFRQWQENNRDKLRDYRAKRRAEARAS